MRHLRGVNILSKGIIHFIGKDVMSPYPSTEVFNSWNLKNDFTQVTPANSADLALPVGMRWKKER